MAALVIAIGNALRGDDGVAHAVADRLRVAARRVIQLTPEIAAEIAGHDPVIFIDADAGAERIRIQPVSSTRAHAALTHVSTPAEVVALARALYGFSGRAFVCGIPARDFSPVKNLGSRASELAESAAWMLRTVLS